jgi:hypothetical protein
MAKSRIEFERQPCRICGRATMHKVTIAADGRGRRVASAARCLEHEEFTSGRIDMLGPDGEWRSVVESAS